MAVFQLSVVSPLLLDSIRSGNAESGLHSSHYITFYNKQPAMKFSFVTKHAEKRCKGMQHSVPFCDFIIKPVSKLCN